MCLEEVKREFFNFFFFYFSFVPVQRVGAPRGRGRGGARGRGKWTQDPCRAVTRSAKKITDETVL
jgi:hypothetical protein